MLAAGDPHPPSPLPPWRRVALTPTFAGGAGLALLLLWPAPDNRLAARGGDGARPTIARQLPALARRGPPLMLQYQCGNCHHIAGVAGAIGTRGPSLLQWGRRSYIAGQLPNTQELLAQWIADPTALLPGTAMPSLGVTPADAQAMAAYLLMQQ